jgi:hypothetical protein
LDEQPQQLEEIISAVIEPLVQSLASAGGSFSTTGKTKENSCLKKLRTSRIIGKVDTSELGLRETFCRQLKSINPIK